MLSNPEYVRQSLELHLFFSRIMKEHSFFLQTSFTPKDSRYAEQADRLRIEFDRLLAEAVLYSKGALSPDVLHSWEIVTPYTLDAETVSSYFTGVEIPVNLTKTESELTAGMAADDPRLVPRVNSLNERIIAALKKIIDFKMNLLSGVTSCKMFTGNYPLLIDHILREARLYLRLTERLQLRSSPELAREAHEQEVFWNDIMAEHAKFIRGLLDPSEDELFRKANEFAKEFDELTQKAKQAPDLIPPRSPVTEESLRATEEIRKFKTAGTKGILDCKIRSIIIPLLADHTLREASHYLRLLRQFRG